MLLKHQVQGCSGPVARRLRDNANSHCTFPEVVGDAGDNKRHDGRSRVSSYGTYGQRSRYGSATSFHRVAEIGAFSPVAVAVETASEPVVVSDVEPRIGVVKPVMLVNADRVNADRLCASQHWEQQQENEAKHENLRCDGEIICAQGH